MKPNMEYTLRSQYMTNRHLSLFHILCLLTLSIFFKVSGTKMRLSLLYLLSLNLWEVFLELATLDCH